MGLLDGSVALVTGAGSGLGRAVAERYLAEGANVGLLEIMPEKVAGLKELVGSRGVVVEGDVTEVGDVDRLVSETVSAFGRLDNLTGCQGIWDGNQHLRQLPRSDLRAAFDDVFHVNVLGYLMSAQACIEELAKTNGSITFTASIASFVADGGGPLYTASKHAVLGLVRQLAFELAPKIRVNGVAPGAIGGSDLRGPQSLGQHNQSQADAPRAAMEEMIKGFMPLQQFTLASDYGMLFAMLADRKSSPSVTGHVIEAHGGMSVRGFREVAGGLDL